MADLIQKYDPNIRWAKTTIEITYMMWEYSHTVEVEIGGNCRGWHVMDVAISTHADQLFKELGNKVVMVLTRPAEVGLGEDTLEDGPDDPDDLEGWLERLCVGVRIVEHVPEVRNG